MVAESGRDSVVVDANVLIAVIRPDIGHVPPEEAEACAQLIDTIDRGQVRAYLCAPVLAEVMHVLARSGISAPTRNSLWARWEAMSGRLDIIPVDGTLAVEAGEYRQKHYHRERLPLSYIDCFCVALARKLAVPLITIEAPLLRAPGITAISPSRWQGDFPKG